MQEEILSQLKDVHWPNAPAWWPLAPGVYGLSLGILILGLGAYFLWRLKRAKLKKSLLKEIMVIEEGYQLDLNNAQLQAALSGLLKRMAFHKDPTLPRNRDLSDMKPCLLGIFRRKNELEQIVTLLELDRFSKNPQLDGLHLLQLFREQLKRCRI